MIFHIENFIIISLQAEIYFQGYNEQIKLKYDIEFSTFKYTSFWLQ